MKFSFMQNMRYPKTTISTLLVLILLVVNFIIVITDYQKRRWDFEPRIDHLTYICGAISGLTHHQERYVCLKEVYEKIIKARRDTRSVNNSIKEAMELKNVNFQDGILAAGISVGPGYTDFVYLAFLLFGFKIESLVYVYCLILFASVAVFWLTFRRNSIGPLLLVVFLLSHYFMIQSPALLGGQLGSVINYRFLPVLTILPIIHIFMVSLLGRRLTGRVFTGIFVQSIIILFILWIRGSVIWVVALLIFAVVAKIFLNVLRSRFSSQKVPQEGLATIADIMRKLRLWPLVLFLSMFLLLIVGAPFILKEHHKVSGSTNMHLIWHSVYLGLALQPDIRKSYGTAIYDHKSYGESRGEKVHSIVCSDKYMQGNPIKVAVKTWLCADAHRGVFEIIYAWRHPIEYTPDDQDAFNASFKWLHDHGYSEYELFNFGPEEGVDYKGYFGWFNQSSDMNSKRPYQRLEGINFARHESILKDVIKDVVRTHPLQIAQYIFIAKPVRYLQACFRYLSITSWPIILLLPIVLFHFYMSEIERSRNEIFQVLKLLALIFIFSLIPAFSVYPTYYVIFDSFFILTIATLMAVFILIIPKIRNIMFRKKPEDKDGTQRTKKEY